MNTQEAYEQIRAYFNHADAVLAKSGDDWGTCLYRTETGAKCAVGALIPDEMYSAAMECGGVDVLLHEWPLIKGFLWNVNEAFLRDAQNLHDGLARDASNFVTMLDLLTYKYGLTPIAPFLL